MRYIYIAFFLLAAPLLYARGGGGHSSGHSSSHVSSHVIEHVSPKVSSTKPSTKITSKSNIITRPSSKVIVAPVHEESHSTFFSMRYWYLPWNIWHPRSHTVVVTPTPVK
jgi:hypothetical protein